MHPEQGKGEPVFPTVMRQIDWRCLFLEGMRQFFGGHLRVMLVLSHGRPPRYSMVVPFGALSHCFARERENVGADTLSRLGYWIAWIASQSALS